MTGTSPARGADVAFERLLEQVVEDRDVSAFDAVQNRIALYPGLLVNFTEFILPRLRESQTFLKPLVAGLRIDADRLHRALEQDPIHLLASLCLLADLECRGIQEMLAQVLPRASEKLLYAFIGMAENESLCALRALNQGVTADQLSVLAKSAGAYYAAYPALVKPLLRLFRSGEFRPQCLAAGGGSDPAVRELAELLTLFGNAFAEECLKLGAMPAISEPSEALH